MLVVLVVLVGVWWKIVVVRLGGFVWLSVEIVFFWLDEVDV